MLSKTTPADNEICTAESAIAAVAERGGRVFVVLPPASGVEPNWAAANGYVRLAEPHSADTSTFSSDAGSRCGALDGLRVAMRYGLPKAGGGGTRFSPTAVKQMADDYQLIRPWVDSPWHENLDEKWRPANHLDYWAKQCVPAASLPPLPAPG